MVDISLFVLQRKLGFSVSLLTIGGLYRSASQTTGTREAFDLRHGTQSMPWPRSSTNQHKWQVRHAHHRHLHILRIKDIDHTG